MLHRRKLFIKLEDSYKAKGLRRQLVREIERKGIRHKAILKAFLSVPRHYFFDSAFIEHAYEDKAFPIGEGQTISQPYTVAFQTELLDPMAGKKILEIGTGSGYQACILLELGMEVHSIEYNKKLFDRTRRLLPRMGYKPFFYHGDGSKGLKEHAPYDGIIVTAGAPTIPTDLMGQLKVDGRLVIPVGNKKSQKMILVHKASKDSLIQKEFDAFSFVPLRGAKGWDAK